MNNYEHAGCLDLCKSCGENGDPVLQKLDEVIIIRCQCKNGYAGAFCDRKIDTSNFCCKNKIDLFMIIFIIERNFCADQPCQNQGSCYSSEKGYMCFCFTGYTGINCEIRQ